MMNQKEYSKLLLKLVQSPYGGYSERMACRLLYNKNSYQSFQQNIVQIDGKVFIGLEGYSNYIEGIPTGFFQILDKFTNGAMLVKPLPKSN